MMSTGTRYDSGTGVADVDDGGDGPKGCQWDRGVCVDFDSPSHFIEWGTHGDDSAELTTSVYCARHYAVELAHYTAFHIKECGGLVSAHVGKFGGI